MAECLTGRLERQLNVLGDHEMVNPLFPFSSLLMENWLKLEALKKKKKQTQNNPESVGLCLLTALPKREDETAVEGPLQSLALETVTSHGRWPPFWTH